MTSTILAAQINPELSDREFMKLSQLIHELSGINLGEHKQSLLRARLVKRLRALGIPTFTDYYDFVTQGDSSGEESIHMLDAISTNLTEFFREPAHFDYLKDVFFRRWKNEPVIKILSAGCSTGEEAYSIAICNREVFGESASLKLKIVAGDICTRALARAKAGIYDTDKIKSISPQRLRANFMYGTGSSRGLVCVSPEVRSSVEFMHLNLTEPLHFNGPFHAIFCRNVAIYFNKATQAQVFEKLGRSLLPGGTMFVGHAESLTTFSRGFAYVQPAVYERR